MFRRLSRLTAVIAGPARPIAAGATPASAHVFAGTAARS